MGHPLARAPARLSERHRRDLHRHDVELRRVPKRAYATLRAEEVPVLLPHVEATWRNFFAAGLWTALRKGELCGLLFDGTYESLGSDYLFEPHTRSIQVDATYMLWVMDAVDHAHSQLREMGVTPRF